MTWSRHEYACFNSSGFWSNKIHKFNPLNGSSTPFATKTAPKRDCPVRCHLVHQLSPKQLDENQVHNCITARTTYEHSWTQNRHAILGYTTWTSLKLWTLKNGHSQNKLKNLKVQRSQISLFLDWCLSVRKMNNCISSSHFRDSATSAHARDFICASDRLRSDGHSCWTRRMSLYVGGCWKPLNSFSNSANSSLLHRLLMPA